MAKTGTFTFTISKHILERKKNVKILDVYNVYWINTL